MEVKRVRCAKLADVGFVTEWLARIVKESDGEKKVIYEYAFETEPDDRMLAQALYEHGKGDCFISVIKTVRIVEVNGEKCV